MFTCVCVCVCVCDLGFLIWKYVRGVKANEKPGAPPRTGQPCSLGTDGNCSSLNIRLRFAKCFGWVSFELRSAHPMSKAHFAPFVSFCNRVEVVVVVKSPFGISDPGGMQTPRPRCQVPDSHNECLLPPFLSVYLPRRCRRRDRFISRKIPYARFKSPWNICTCVIML